MIKAFCRFPSDITLIPSSLDQMDFKQQDDREDACGDIFRAEQTAEYKTVTP